MSKGLTRSLGRALAQVQPVTKLTIPLNNLAVAVANGSSASGVGSAVISGLPQGNLLFLGAVANVQFSSADADVTATFDGDFSVGSAPSADATLNGSEVDIIPSTAMGAATAKVSPMIRSASASSQTGAILDNTDGSLELNLNVLIDDASQSGAVDLTVAGVLYLAFIVLGDD